MYEILERQCFAVILLLLLEAVNSQKNVCPLQFSDVRKNHQRVFWNSSGAAYEIIISVPPCTDENGKILTRICVNGSWVPAKPPICYRTAHKYCPENMIENSDKCIFINKPRTWEEKCKYIGGNANVSLTDVLTWLPVKRKVKYGPYESVIRGKDYGLPIEGSYKISYNSKDVFTKDCLVTISKENAMIPVNCNEKHMSVCPVNEDESECSEGCVNAGILSRNCFCKKRYCKKLAEITSVSDKIKLSKLVQTDKCNVAETFKTNLTLLGFKQALQGDSWFLTQEYLSCSLCVMPQKRLIARVEMILEFDPKKKLLTLIIYSSNNLHKNSDNENSVYCFTNAANQLKKKVNLKHFLNIYEGSNIVKYFNVELQKYVGHYWCEAHIKGSEKLVYSNKILAYRRKSGNEYSLRLKIKEICEMFDCSISGGELNYSQFANEISTLILLQKYDVSEIRVMEVFSFDFNTLDFLLHITTRQPDDPEKEINDLNIILKKMNENIDVIYLRHSENCLSETKQELIWPRTKIGEVAVPNNPCLSSSNLPVLRVCTGDFMYGSEWSDIIEKCHSHNLSESTQYLYSMYQKNISTSYISDIAGFTENKELTVLGHYFLTKFMRKISDYEFSRNETYAVVVNTLKITNNIMRMNSETLFEAEKQLNITDEIIDALEDFTNKWNNSNDFLLINQNIILHIANPFSTNTTGMLMYNNNYEIFVENFKQGFTYDNLDNKTKLQFAYYVPEKILNEIPENKRSSIRIISTIFLKPQLFPTTTTNVSGPVVSIIIQGLDYLPSPIPVWFRVPGDQKNPICAYWDYGKRTIRHKGNWSQTGGRYIGKISNDSSIHVCSFSHLTHFALLVANAQVDPNSTNELILDIITVTGDVLSLTGIIGIITTALFFKNWGRKTGTKILLNLSIAISLEIIAFFLVQFRVVYSDFHCEIVGPILHYLILCKFFWMLIYAFLQYNRFVKVLTAIPTNIVSKSVVFGWGFAIIPVVIVSTLSPNTYSINNHNFCYPKNIYLYLGLYMPIVLVISLNTVVFFIVMRNISSTMAESYVNKMDNRTQKLQLKLAALLFFVLGLPFFLGVSSNLVETDWLQITMIYLFCTTSNIQGFILFLFYVILNKETRQQWIKYYSRIKVKNLNTITSTRNLSSNS